MQAAAPTPADIADAVQRRPLDALLDVARNMFPDNVAAAAVDMNILGVITFSLFFGLCLSTVGEDADPMVKLVDVSLLPLLRSSLIGHEEAVILVACSLLQHRLSFVQAGINLVVCLALSM